MSRLRKHLIDLSKMAHIVFLARGIKQNVELWEKFMETQFFPWERTNLQTGEKEKTLVQGALRPIQLYEYVFPKESTEEVINMLQPFWKLDKSKELVLRKALGKNFKAVPKIKEAPSRTIFKAGVAIYPIAYKEDVVTENYGYRQEML